MSRAEFARLLPFTAGGSAVLLAGCEKDEPEFRDSTVGGDAPALQALIRMEDVSVAFWAHALDRGLPDGVAGERFLGQEHEHVQVLEAHARRLGVLRPDPAEILFSIDGGKRRMLEVAARVENLVTASGIHQLGRLSDLRLIRDTLSILAVEGAHAAALDALVGSDTATDLPDHGIPALRAGAFDRPLDRDAVLELLEDVGVDV